MSTQSEIQEPRRIGLHTILTDGFAIAVATAFAYFLSFVYELGYCSRFAIPAALISPNTSTILVMAAAVGSVFISTANFLGFTTPLFRKAKKEGGNPTWSLLGYTAIAIILSQAIYKYTFRQFFVTLGWLLALLLALVILSGFYAVAVTFWQRFRNKKRLAARSKNLSQTGAEQNTALIKQKPEPSENISYSLDEFFENWMPPKLARLTLLVLMLLFVAWILGDGNASTQQKFLTMRDAPNSVVLRIYGDLMIVASVDRETHEVSEDLSLVWISEKKQLNFVNENVGPLTLKKSR